MATCSPPVRDALTRRRVLGLAGALALGGATAPRGAASPGTLTIFVAASLVEVMEELARSFGTAHGARVQVSAAASSALARQIEAGANVDVFVSADQAWMDYLAHRGLVDPSTRRDIAGNTLVLVAPRDAAIQLALAPGVDLAKALGDGRLAVGDVETVPAGRYAKSALVALGAWEGVKDRLASTDSVRSALAFVARGEAPLGIVYGTDAKIEPRVRVVDAFPANSHAPITYPAAAVRGAGPLAGPWLDWLAAPTSREAFRRHGFIA